MFVSPRNCTLTNADRPGIGLAFASALCQTGAKTVYILGRRLQVLQDAAKKADPSGDVVVPVQCDVADQASVTEVVKRIEKDVGYIDVLINNAGVTGPDNKSAYNANSIEELQKVLSQDWDGWHATFAVNTTAVAGVTTAFLGLLDKGNARRGWQTGKLQSDSEPRGRDMKAAGEGISEDDIRTSQVISVSSIAGFNRIITAGMAYTASKAGATMLGKTFASLLSPYGIRSNVICPGIYPSEMTVSVPQQFAWNKVPAGRKGTFEEIAALLLYLVGRGGAYVNGAVEMTDGGRLGTMQATY